MLRQNNTQISATCSGGFTLLELTIVLAISGFMIAVSASTAMTRIEVQRIKSTNQRLDFIMKAIDQYVRTYGHLPCPADPTLTYTDTNLGNGTGTGGTSNEPLCNALNLRPLADAGVIDNQILMGAIPTIQLGIAPTLAIDGWDRKFSYVVDETLTMTGEAATNTGYAGNTGAITVENANGDAYTNTAAVIVFSHGPVGIGAYPGSGGTSTIAGTPGTEEAENTNQDDVFVQIFPTGTFDDIMEYRNQWQLAQDD